MKAFGIVIILVVVALVGVGWYVLANHKNASVTVSVQTTATPSLTVSPSPSLSGSPTPSASPTPVSMILNTKANTSAGTVLTGSNSMTLYTYGKDSSGVSNCTGTCASNWPPYTISSTTGLVAATGILGKLGTITRADGSLQLTYKGMPLYFWSGDSMAGDTTGNNINSFVVAKP